MEDDRRGGLPTKRGRVWEGVFPPTHIAEFLHLGGIKVSDLVHIFDEFLGILSIPKLIGKYTTTKYASSLSGERSDRAGDCVGGGIPLPTPGSFWILRIQSERSAYFW